MSPEVARCLAALDISFLIPAAIVFLEPRRLSWLSVLLHQTSPPDSYGYCVSRAMPLELAWCLAASDISFLIPSAVVFLGPCRLKWLDVLLH